MRSNLDNYFLDLLNDFPDAVSGDVESPTGYFAVASIPSDDVPDEFVRIIGDDGHANMIIVQGSLGFVEGYYFSTHKEALDKFSEIEENYLYWLEADESEV